MNLLALSVVGVGVACLVTVWLLVEKRRRGVVAGLVLVLGVVASLALRHERRRGAEASDRRARFCDQWASEFATLADLVAISDGVPGLFQAQRERMHSLNNAMTGTVVSFCVGPMTFDACSRQMWAAREGPPEQFVARMRVVEAALSGRRATCEVDLDLDLDDLRPGR